MSTDNRDNLHRNVKHTAVLEGINEEQCGDDENTASNENKSKPEVKNDTSPATITPSAISNAHEINDEPSNNNSNADDQEKEKNIERRSNSISTTDDYSHMNSHTIERDKGIGRYTRHMSIDQRSAANKNNAQALGSQDAIDRYYERNQYTVTGRDRNSDVYNKLPLHLQQRVGGINHPETMSRISKVSKMSTPGALGDNMMPTERRFDTSLYWLALHTKKIGFRHIIFILIAISYSLLGATIFYTIESKHEQQQTLMREANMEKLMAELGENLANKVNDPNITLSEIDMKEFVKKSYLDLLKLEGLYDGSTYYKLEDYGNNWKWTFGSAFFFSMNVYTTTGYGSIAPETTIAQFITFVYGFIFVPVTFVIVRHFGQFFLVHLTRLYAHMLQKYRELNGNKHVDEDEIIRLPLIICFALMAAYLAMCTFVIYFYDDYAGKEPDTGVTLFIAFYFSYISLTTIGLGDIMPNNVPFSPIISIMFFIGMSVTKVVNRTTYLTVENGIFGFMTLFENKIDSIVNGRNAAVHDETTVAVGAKTPQRRESIGSTVYDDNAQNEMLNNLTIRSIATFMKSNADIYGGGFGRVQLRRGDLMNYENQNTVNSMSQIRHRTNSQSQTNQHQSSEV